MEQALERGTQIVYIPDHAEGDINHSDCEAGFVTSAEGDVAWCRYWSKFHYGLRTTTCSESTPVEKLVVQASRPQREIEQLLTQIQEAEQLALF